MERNKIKDELGACLEKMHVLGDFTWDMGEELTDCVEKMMKKDFDERLAEVAKLEVSPLRKFLATIKEKQ